MAGNDLVLTTHEQEQAHDELLASLGELATSSAVSEPVVVPVDNKKFRSRFFFHIDESFHTSVAKRRKSMKKTGQEHVDDEITQRLATYSKVMPNVMGHNIEAVREFFLTEIAPRTIAIGAGVEQARAVVQRLIGSAVDGTQFSKFERMNAAAVDIRMAKFIAKQFKLPASDVLRLLSAISPTPVQHVLPPPLQQEASQPRASQPYESRHAKAKRKRKEEGPERSKTPD